MGLPLVPANALEISSYRGEAGLGLASLAEPAPHAMPDSVAGQGYIDSLSNCLLAQHP